MSGSPEQSNGLRNLHGREFNALNQEYMLPADAPEMKRLNTQHQMMLLALGGLYPDNYAEAIRRGLEHREGETVEIADLGSGSGDWVSDMAKEFPHTQAVGMDLAPSVPNGVAPNVRFETRDLTKSLAECNGRFDMVQARCVANGINDYPVFLVAMSQMLKPGGILMLMEGYLQLYDEVLNVVQPTGGVAKFLFEVVARQASPNGLGLDRIGENLEGWVRKNGGFKNIQTHILYVPVGWSGSPGVCKEPIAAGRLMMDNMKTFLRAWDPMFISMGVPEAEVNQWVSEAREQLEDPDKLRVYTKWIIVCGEKVE